MGSVVSFWKSTIRCIHSISAVVDDVSLARARRSARRSRSTISARWAGVMAADFLSALAFPSLPFLARVPTPPVSARGP
jgi:geranylgeranyl pyrophosphate synthase